MCRIEPIAMGAKFLGVGKSAVDRSSRQRAVESRCIFPQIDALSHVTTQLSASGIQFAHRR